MPNIFTGEPTKAEKELSDRIAGLESNSRRDSETIRSLEDEVRLNRAAGAIAVHALEVLRQIDENDDIRVGYEALARNEVIEDLLEEHKDKNVAEIIAEKRAMWEREALQPEQMEKAKLAIADELESNGTIDRLRAEADAERKQQYVDEAISAVVASIAAELDQPDVAAAAIAKAIEKIKGSEQYTKLLNKARKERQPSINEAAINAAKAEIDELLASQEPSAIEKAKEQWINSAEGKRYKQQAEQAAADKVKKLTRAQAAEELDDTVYKDLLAREAEIRKQRLTEKLTYEEHLAGFATSGIDVMKINEGVPVSLYLGEVQGYTTKEKDTRQGAAWNAEVTVLKKRLLCARLLHLMSLGEGRYMVRDDSYQRSAHPLEVKASIASGTVIHIGQRLSENGVDKLDYRIMQGVPFCYDDDTTDDMPIIDGYIGVATVQISGIDARKDIDEIKLPEAKR